MSTLNYLFPTAGGVTAPTKAVMSKHSEVVVEVSVALYDTSVVFTHNMQLSAAELAAGFPEVSILPISVDADTTVPFITAKAANTVTLSVTDAVTQFNAHLRLFIRRPLNLTK